MSASVGGTSPPSSPACSRSRRTRVAAVVVVFVALGCLWWFWPKAATPPPPTVDLRGADPRIVEAIEAARRAVERAPDSAAAWGHLGLVLRAHDYGAEANTCLAQAEKLDPKNPRWPYHQAVVLLASDPEVGIACLRRASDLGGPVTAPTLLLGEVLVSRGEFDEAESLFGRVLVAESLNPRAHHGLGRIAYARGDLAGSQRHLEISAREAPWVQATHSLLAEIYFARRTEGRGRGTRGCGPTLPATSWPDAYLDEVVQLRVGIEPRIAEARGWSSRTESRRRWACYRRLWPSTGFLRRVPGAGEGEPATPTTRLPAASGRCARPSASDLTDPAPQFPLASALEVREQFVQAGEDYARAIARKPDYAFAYYSRGQCLRQQGDQPEALKAFREAARIKPNFPEAHRELGELLAQRGQDADALVQLEQAARLAPGDQKTKKLLDEVRKRIQVPK